MDIEKVKKSQTKNEARDNAIEWQHQQNNQSLSWLEAAEWAQVFSDLADKFDLVDEFQENGII